MLSSVLRRTLLRHGTLFSGQRLSPFSISHNRLLTWPVERGFSTTSSAEPNAHSEPDSKSKSTGNEPKSSKKATRRDKTQEKTKGSAKKAEPKKKQKIIIKPEHRPPKSPGTPYTLWITDWIRTQPKPENLPAAQDRIRQGAQAWHTVSEDEKQRYKEKYEGIKAEHHQRMQEWRENIDPSVLREMNSRRVKKGLNRIRGPSTGSPMNGFFRYFQEVRENTPRTEETHKDHIKSMAKLAGSQWRAMSETEKARYNDPANVERAAWRDRRKAEGHAKQ